MKKALSVLLTLCMLIPFFCVSSFAEDAALEVFFSNDLRGSAAGTYTVTVGKAGTYELIWADAEGDALKTTVGGRELTYTPFAQISVKAATAAVYEPQSEAEIRETQFDLEYMFEEQLASVEKEWQGGAKRLEDLGYRVESLAIVTSIHDDDIQFKNV